MSGAESHPSALTRGLEISLLLCALAAYGLVAGMGIQVDFQIYLTVAFLLALLVLCWRSTGGGVHPSFLFLVLLLLFQGGRLIAFCISPDQVQPLQMASSNGLFDTSLADQRTLLFVIVLSAVAVYVPTRLTASSIKAAHEQRGPLAPYVLAVFLLSYPFLVWKNYLYLRFVTSHGGYLAVYLDHDQLVAQAGFLVRALSRLAEVSFLVYFTQERPGRRLLFVSALFFGASIMELLVGLRGAVMLTALACIFYWKRRRGTRFSLRLMVTLTVLLAVSAQVVAFSREDKKQDFQLVDLPRLFLYSQGTSVDVTLAVIQNYNLFAPRRATYLFNDIRSVWVPVSAFGQGELLDKDIDLAVDPVADAAGFGLGGSYLADSYLYGKFAGVVIISLLIGWGLCFLQQHLSGNAAAFGIVMLISLVYLPRSPIVEEIAYAMEQWIFVAAILAAAAVFAHLHATVREGGLAVSQNKAG